MRSSSKSLLRQAKEKYEFYLHENVKAPDQRSIQAFLKVLPQVRALAESTTPDSVSEVAAFKSQCDQIQDCLMLGIVPSRLLEDKKLFAGRPVAVINASLCFYLEHLSELIGRLEKQKPENIEHRAFWTSRLEMWTMKALEDFALLEAHGAAV